MTISRTVYNQLFDHTETKEQVIRLRPTEAKAGAVVMSSKHRIQMWTKEEHERFLEALEMYPSGPWKKVADHIGTKTPRQTMTHAQKYRQKIYRRQRGLRNQKRGADDAKVAVSPSGVAELSKSGQGDQQTANGANHPHSGFGLLDILAYSAAAAQSGHLPPREGAPYSSSTPSPANQTSSSTPAGQAEYAHHQAYQQCAPSPAFQPSPPVQTAAPSPAYAHSPAQNVGSSSPPPQPQASPANGLGHLCNNSHLPPLSQILQLRGSQVAQQ